MLHEFATLEANHVQCGDGHALLRWRDTLKFASVGAMKGQASGHSIPFSNHLVDGQVPVRKGSMKDADEDFETFPARRESRGEIMAEVIVTCHLVDDC